MLQLICQVRSLLFHSYWQFIQLFSAEQNLEHYALFQEYLTLYENTLSSYIKSLEVSVEEFYSQLVEVKNDSNIKDKKLLHFVNYLLASTDYAAFYKIMVRAARKARKGEQVVSFSTKADSKYESPHNSRADSKSGDFKLCEAKLDSK